MYWEWMTDIESVPTPPGSWIMSLGPYARLIAEATFSWVMRVK